MSRTTAAGGRTVTKAMVRALTAAAQRPDGNVCPVRGVHAGAQAALLKAMENRGFIETRGIGVPHITDAGRAALAKTGGA